MKTKYVNFFSVVVTMIFLAGCVSAPENISDKDTISKKSGVLVAGLHTDWEGHDNPLLASLKLGYKSKVDSAFNYKTLTFMGKNYIVVIELPANKYYFSQLVFGNRWLDIDPNNVFEIKPGTITYIGDITSNVLISGVSVGADLSIEDNYENTQIYLNKEYERLTSSFQIEKQIVDLHVREKE